MVRYRHDDIVELLHRVILILYTDLEWPFQCTVSHMIESPTGKHLCSCFHLVIFCLNENVLH